MAVRKRSYSDEQRRLLDSALKDPPEQLVRDYGGGEALLTKAFAEAEATFEAAESEWSALRADRARVRELTTSPLQRILISLAEADDWGLLLSFLLGVGVGLLGFGLVWPGGPGAELIALYMAVVGAVLLMAPKALFTLEMAYGGGALNRRLIVTAARLRDLQWLALPSFILGCAVIGLRQIDASSAEVQAIGGALASVGSAFFFAREYLGRGLLNRLEIAREAALGSRQAYERRLRGEALARLRAALTTGGSYGTTLRYKDYSGLAEMNDPNREIPTDTRGRLFRMMGLMPGGTIALAGLRGAGKTTLLHSICASPPTRQKDEAPLHVVVDAPVQYDARDFVLHLFAQLCVAVVGEKEVARLRGADRPFGLQASSRTAVIQDPQMLFGMLCFAIGAFLTLGAVMGVAVASPLGWGVILMAAGYLLVLPRFLSRPRRDAQSEGEGAESPPRDSNVHTAILRLRQIWFQQSFSQGWSGGFKVPIGIEGGLTGSTELSEQQLSLPDIVDLFRDFLNQVAGQREVRIGVDELDKMSEEDARRFLSELKVVFGIPDCFFFISISEDAMSRFERRGLHVRDIFDSSLDAVVHVPQLTFEVSLELLERRIVDLPIPFAALLHCVSGGLPRDLIRAARELIALEQGVSLNGATTRLLRDDLRAKVAAVKVATRAVEFDGWVFSLVDWLDRLALADLTPGSLLNLCEELDGGLLLELTPPGSGDGESPGRGELRALATQLSGFAYFAATLLEFFSMFEDSDFAARATKADALGDRSPLVDRLAAANHAFSAGVNTAWEMVSDFRQDAELEGVLPFPAHPSRRADDQVSKLPAAP